MIPKKSTLLINALCILTIFSLFNCNSDQNAEDTLDIRVYYTDYLPSKLHENVFSYFPTLRKIAKKNKHIRLTFIPESKSPLFIPESRYYGLRPMQIQDITGKVYEGTSKIVVVFKNRYRRIHSVHGNSKDLESTINRITDELTSMKYEDSHSDVNKPDMTTEYNYSHTFEKPPVPKKHVLTALATWLNHRSFYISAVTGKLPVKNCISRETIRQDSLLNSQSGVGVLRTDFMESNCRQAIDCGLMEKNIIETSDSICKEYSLTETGRNYSTHISTWFNENCIAFKVGNYKLNRILDISDKIVKKSHKTTFTYFNVTAEVNIVNKAPWVNDECKLPEIDTLFQAITKVNGTWTITNRITP